MRLKSAAVLLSATASIALLAGCSAPATSPVAKSTATVVASPSPTPTQEPVPDLTGEWVQSNSRSTDSYQAATITASTIAVNWVTDGGATTSVYWAGSFTPPTAAGDYTWTSNNDTSVTESALLASSDPTKEFTYSGGVIRYQVSALGTTTTVELKKK